MFCHVMTSKLQQKLPNYFGNAIIVEKQREQGKSNTIFSSSISVSETIHAANNLKAELKITELQTFFRLVQCLISCLKGRSLCMTSDTMHFPRNCQLTELS
jgi:hypothetical protein